jgi:hypothetical protein
MAQRASDVIHHRLWVCEVDHYVGLDPRQHGLDLFADGDKAESARKREVLLSGLLIHCARHVQFWVGADGRNDLFAHPTERTRYHHLDGGIGCHDMALPHDR